MSAATTRRLILEVVLTDNTFTLESWRGLVVWSGRCIHCKSKLYVERNGAPMATVTIEHIVPRTHGGTDDARNLALACAACNHGKGVRLDKLKRDDPRLVRVIEQLTAERDRRWRAPEEAPGRIVERG